MVLCIYWSILTVDEVHSSVLADLFETRSPSILMVPNSWICDVEMKVSNLRVLRVFPYIHTIRSTPDNDFFKAKAYVLTFTFNQYHRDCNKQYLL
jgi:hypothetical protein